jgi:hypothetical protein
MLLHVKAQHVLKPTLHRVRFRDPALYIYQTMQHVILYIHPTLGQTPDPDLKNQCVVLCPHSAVRESFVAVTLVKPRFQYRRDVS